MSSTETLEFAGDDAGYAWWRNTHPAGYVLAIRARHPPVLHLARCKDADRDVRRGRLTARGARQVCADTKVALREWLKREQPDATGMIERCPKCAP
jgi:hypothetical protein